MTYSRRDAPIRSLIASISRRGLVTVVGGLLARGVIWPGELETAASQGRQRRRKRKRREKRKRRNDGNQPPPAPPEPVVRVDARCFGSSDIDFAAIENSRLAQSFTALSSGTLVRVELQIAKDELALDEWLLRLSPVDAAGLPTNDTLAEAIVADASVPLGDATVVAFDFAAPFAVVAGTTYGLVLTRGEFFRWSARSGDICRGSAFHSSDQTASFIETDRDFIFTAFVRS